MVEPRREIAIGAPETATRTLVGTTANPILIVAPRRTTTGFPEAAIGAPQVVPQQYPALARKAVQGGNNRGRLGGRTGAVESVRVVGAHAADGEDPIAQFGMSFDIDGNKSTLGGNAPSTSAQGIDDRRIQRERSQRLAGEEAVPCIRQ